MVEIAIEYILGAVVGMVGVTLALNVKQSRCIGRIETKQASALKTLEKLKDEWEDHKHSGSPM